MPVDGRCSANSPSEGNLPLLYLFHPPPPFSRLAPPSLGKKMKLALSRVAPKVYTNENSMTLATSNYP